MTKQEIKNSSTKDLQYRLIILEARLQMYRVWNVGALGVNQEIVWIKDEMRERGIDTKEIV
jgi:hypothetical protein